MVKHEEGMERMARAIKQSVDGSGYPSSALFPITAERETQRRERRRGGGHQEDAIYATDADTDERADDLHFWPRRRVVVT